MMQSVRTDALTVGAGYSNKNDDVKFNNRWCNVGQLVVTVMSCGGTDAEWEMQNELPNTHLCKEMLRIFKKFYFKRALMLL